MMIATYVHDSAYQKKPTTIDYQGIALLAISVGALQFVLEHGQREDWFDSRFILALTAIGVVGGVAALWRELTTDHPGDRLPRAAPPADVGRHAARRRDGRRAVRDVVHAAGVSADQPAHDGAADGHRAAAGRDRDGASRWPSSAG